jgi:hypothetical protein
MATALMPQGINEFGASLFLPRRLDFDKSGEVQVSVEAIVSSLSSKQSPPLTAPFNLLDSQWLLPRPEGLVGILNTPRIVGSALAVFSLSLLRADPTYVSAISHKGSAGEIAAKANAMIEGLSAPLSKQFGEPGFLKAPGAAYLVAASSSGYSDLARFVGNDIQGASYWAGVDEAHQEDLIAIKHSLGNAVPGLENALDLPAAIDAIGKFITQQQVEIAQFHTVVDDLQKVVDNLNNLLVSANQMIAQLGAEIGATLGQVGNAAKAATGLMKAGTGLLIGGPVGGILCLVFC